MQVSAIALSMKAAYNKQTYLERFCFLFRSNQLQIQLFTCHTTAWTQTCITCLSADNVVFPLFLMANNFHHCCHRKVAIRQTLPNIQISLSLRKFSMVETFLFQYMLSTCKDGSYFSLSAPCGEGDLDGG